MPSFFWRLKRKILDYLYALCVKKAAAEIPVVVFGNRKLPRVKVFDRRKLRHQVILLCHSLSLFCGRSYKRGDFWVQVGGKKVGDALG